MVRTVADVMTREVVAVRESTSFKDVVRLMRGKGVSAVPVLDSEDRVVGVVSEADLMLKQEMLEQAPLPLFERRRRRRERAKAIAKVAGELMTAPAVTISALAPISEAARLMHRNGVKRLPVVADQGRLVGIVSRADLIKVFLRSDEEIQRDAEDQLALPLRISPGAIQVSVRDGVARVEGRVRKRSEIPIIVDSLRRIDGVIAIDSRLSFEVDDEPESWVVPHPLMGP